ncbi:HTH-type transcriptional regulator YjiE [Achromobacter pulmonis]|uniref:LysR family transcriptional regulator n=1 Tax=Achromobacter pulmonis TaxID=1389932 RepID=UPI001469240F|nr:LysR substrate-binding domain-containing protein [Achromobacter pulmonis]CAB3628107.1 HTH-type transcriptional regulator YjiE [Achromobacter pulmonis]
MDIKWLEDFVALSKVRNLFQAAEARNVTHPAFGRRIKALEDWAGVPLVERGHQVTSLNAAGRSMLAAAIDVLDILRETRQGLQKPELERSRRIVIASGKTLAHSMLPELIASVQRGVPPFQLKVITTTLNYGIDMLADGEVDFLLCHAHEPLYAQIDNPNYRCRRVGADKLVAVSAPLAPGGRHPRHAVPKLASDPAVPFLAYADSMSLGRILRDRLRGLCVTAQLQTLYESDLADALHAMARQGFGLAWLPHTLVESDLRAGTLVRADSARNDIHMEIRLYQSVDHAKPLARQVWSRIEAYAAR